MTYYNGYNEHRPAGRQADSSVPYIVSPRYYIAPLPAFTERWLNMSSPRQICSVPDELFNTKSMMKLQMGDETSPKESKCKLDGKTQDRCASSWLPPDPIVESSPKGDGGAPEIGHARGRLRFAGTNFLSLALVLPYARNGQNQHTATPQCD